MGREGGQWHCHPCRGKRDGNPQQLREVSRTTDEKAARENMGEERELNVGIQ